MASRQIFVCRDIREEQLFMQVSFFQFSREKLQGMDLVLGKPLQKICCIGLNVRFMKEWFPNFFSGKTRPRVRKEKKKKVEN